MIFAGHRDRFERARSNVLSLLKRTTPQSKS